MLGRGKKPQPPATPAFALNAPKAEGSLHAACEHFAGRGDAVHNTAGCVLSAEMVLARNYPADPFRLMVRSGDGWFCVAIIPEDDPGFHALRDAGAIVTHGPSPAEIEERQRREAERQAQIEAERAEQAARVAVHRRRRDEALARHRAAVAAR